MATRPFSCVVGGAGFAPPGVVYMPFAELSGAVSTAPS